MSGTVFAEDVVRVAQAIVRMELEAIANMTADERRIATPQNQAVWIVRALSNAGLIAATEGAPDDE